MPDRIDMNFPLAPGRLSEHKVLHFGATAKDVEVIQVVRTRLRTLGEGTEDDPIRALIQYWTLDGKLLAEVDPTA